MSESGYDDNKRPDKTYVSKSLPSFGDEARKVRIASKVFQSPDDYAFALVHNELVLRHTKGGKRIIKAKFFEDNRKIFVLNIQGYTYATDKPHNASFAFIGDEIGKLQEFLNNIQSVPFRDEGGVNVSDEQLRRMVLSDKQVKTLLAGKHELIAEILRSEVTKEDIVAVGYRRKQLDTFERLLSDAEFFAKIKAKKGLTNESLWQSYFEKNTWVFGYGLGYIFLSALDESKLEQVVQGHSVAGYGKRVDALMRTRGVISSLCFVEIKTHTTPLLAKTPYRVGCWAPSEELAGAVSQVQGTVHSATETIGAKLTTVGKDGAPTGKEAFNYQPKSYLVVGDLNEFQEERGVNVQKYRSFELYRKNTLNPEIITFDELYERAKYIVQHNEQVTQD